MAVDAVIASIFDLPVVSEPSCDAASCDSVVGYLSKFCSYGSPKNCRWIKGPECDAFQSVVKILQNSEPSETIDWLPGYGCAVMESTNGCQSGEVALNMIALDLHRFQTTSKSSLEGHQYFDTGYATDYEVLHIGICAIEELPERKSAFQILLENALSRSGEERSARGDKQGHQRTPAFIHALYRQAFNSSTVEELPRGGFTDVGLHTGGESRSTAGPLVFSTLHQALLDYEAHHDESISSDLLFNKIISYFGLYICHALVEKCDTKVSSSPKSNAPDILLEYAFHILQSASLKASALSDKGLDMTSFRDWSKDIRKSVIDRAARSSSEFSKQFVLPDDEAIRGTYDNFAFEIPPPYSPAKDSSPSESEIYTRELENLGWFNLSMSDDSLEDIRQWVKGMKESAPHSKDGTARSLFVLRKVEGLMWGYANDLPVMEQGKLDSLASIVDDYREILNNFHCSGKGSILSAAQLKSR